MYILNGKKHLKIFRHINKENRSPQKELYLLQTNCKHFVGIPLFSQSRFQMFLNDLDLLVQVWRTGNIVSADTVYSTVFRSFRPWDRYIDINISDTRTLPNGRFSFLEKRYLYFENSIAIAFEGNRIAKLWIAYFSERESFIKYKLSEDDIP